MAIELHNAKSTLERSGHLFKKALKQLEENITDSKILITGKSIVEYGPSDVDLLRDLLRRLESISLEFSPSSIKCGCNDMRDKYKELFSHMYEDPIGFFVKIRRIKIEEYFP